MFIVDDHEGGGSVIEPYVSRQTPTPRFACTARTVGVVPLHTAFLKDARVPEEIRSSKLRVLLELPPGREPVISADVVNLANQSTFEQIMDAIDKHQAQHGHRRIVEMKAVHLRDHVSTCISTTQREVDHFNMMCTQILDGRLVEFCSRDRNYLIGEVGPPLEAQGKDSKEGMNCSYPGKWPVTSNPVMWNKHITAENRQMKPRSNPVEELKRRNDAQCQRYVVTKDVCLYGTRYRYPHSIKLQTPRKIPMRSAYGNA
eukprot:gene16060-19047_t